MKVPGAQLFFAVPCMLSEQIRHPGKEFGLFFAKSAPKHEAEQYIFTAM